MLKIINVIYIPWSDLGSKRNLKVKKKQFIKYGRNKRHYFIIKDIKKWG